jgi:hypothetical protein
LAKREKQLTSSLRARGLRNKIAKQLARATSGEAKPRTAHRAVSDLASVVEEIRDRLNGGEGKKRSAAARRAARTRKHNARKRSQAAKRGARTRAQA